MDRIRLALASFAWLGTFATGPAPALAGTSNPFVPPPQQPPQQDVILRATPEEMAAIIQEIGYRAEILKNDQGKRRIRTRIGGRNVTVIFYDCDAKESCASIGLRSYFSDEKNKGLAFANEWNRTKRFARVYIDSDNDIGMDYDVTFVGGITKKNIREHVDIFEDEIKELVDRLRK